MHANRRRPRSAVATAVAADPRLLLTVGLATLLGLVLILISPAAWLPAT